MKIKYYSFIVTKVAVVAPGLWINSGGFYVFHDFMVEDDRNGPHLAALWQLQHLAFTPTDKSITPSWVSKLLKEQGFIKVKNDILIPAMTKAAWGFKV